MSKSRMPSRRSEDFDGRPFVAGSLIGIRAFRVNRAGMLIGVVHEQEWTPDINEAACRLSGFGQIVRLNEQLTGRAREHHVAGLGCQCGFYAYFKGRNTYMGPGNVVGLVEGYGVCTVGERGFRAEKARLVALVSPGRNRFQRARRYWQAYLRGVRRVVRPPVHQIPHQIQRLLGGDPWAEATFPTRRARAARWMSNHCDQLTNHAQTALGAALVMTGLWVVDGWLGSLVWFIGMSTLWAVGKPEAASTIPRLSLAEFEAVARVHYPNVPVYRSRRAAVRAFPLTPPDKQVA